MFLPRLNLKLPTYRLREIFNEVDTRKRLEIGFDDFTILYNKLIFDENVTISLHHEIPKKSLSTVIFSEDTGYFR